MNQPLKLSLANLANRGLVRRAQKDLETARPALVSVTDDRLQLQIAEAVVDVPALPNKSRCTCPASGVCRHILAALLFFAAAFFYETDLARVEKIQMKAET